MQEIIKHNLCSAHIYSNAQLAADVIAVIIQHDIEPTGVIEAAFKGPVIWVYQPSDAISDKLGPRNIMHDGEKQITTAWVSGCAIKWVTQKTH